MSERHPHILHLAGYHGHYAGSFVPMLTAARAAVESVGWSFEVVFPRAVQSREWLKDLRSTGMAAAVMPDLSRRAATSWLLRKLKRQDRATVVHTHFTQWDIAAALAAPLAGQTATVWHLHSGPDRRTTTRARNTLRFGLLGRRVQRILCVGPEVLQMALDRKAPADRVQLFPNAIDTARFIPVTADQRAAARNALGLPRDAEVLLCFAWDWQLKGGPLFLEITSELRRRGRPALGLLVESAHAGAARGAGVPAPDVRTIDPVSDVRFLYAAADVFVAPSTAEGMPFSVLEALCCGLPVVASDLPAHKFAAEGIAACRVVPRSSGAFADAIEAHLDLSPAERATRLTVDRKQIARGYSLDQWSQRLQHLYEEILPVGHRKSVSGPELAGTRIASAER